MSHPYGSGSYSTCSCVSADYIFQHFFAVYSNGIPQRSPGADQLTPQANTYENSLTHPSVCPRTERLSFTPSFTISPPQAAIKLLTALGR